MKVEQAVEIGAGENIGKTLIYRVRHRSTCRVLLVWGTGPDGEWDN